MQRVFLILCSRCFSGQAWKHGGKRAARAGFDPRAARQAYFFMGFLGVFMRCFQSTAARCACRAAFFKDFLTTKCIDMKTVLFFLALFLATARPATAQAVVKTGTVAQCRLDKVTIPNYGRHSMYFVEAVVEGKTQLLLLPADCPVRAGTKFRMVEGHDTPRYILVDGSGTRWFCFMARYLNK